MNYADFSFNPAAFYALWYVHGRDYVLNPLHMVGSFIGSLIAGILCCHLAPDDPNSYEKPKRYLKIPKIKSLLKQIR